MHINCESVDDLGSRVATRCRLHAYWWLKYNACYMPIGCYGVLHGHGLGCASTHTQPAAHTASGRSSLRDSQTRFWHNQQPARESSTAAEENQSLRWAQDCVDRTERGHQVPCRSQMHWPQQCNLRDAEDVLRNMLQVRWWGSPRPRAQHVASEMVGLTSPALNHDTRMAGKTVSMRIHIVV